MIKVGLTGGIGSGKSTVAAIFEKLNIPVFYADNEAKWILNHDLAVKEQLVALFGSDIYDNESLNRKKLADIIFNNEDAIRDVNAVVHPAVADRFKSWSLVQDAPYVLQEAAISFETGGYKRMDKNILVTAPKQLRIERIMNRDNASQEEVESRMANQWDENEKKPLADFVILNDGSEMLLPQIRQIHENLLRFSNQGG